MKWKKNVYLVHDKNLQFKMDDQTKIIDKNDEYIALAVEKGIYDDTKLIALVAKKENINQIAAAFAFTQFILDYGTFIEADYSHYEITG